MESIPARKYKQLKKRFRHAVWRGTGEAHLLMREYPQVDFYEEIVFGIRNICAYDGQCEGGRGKYIYELIQLSARNDELREEVLRSLKEYQEDDWDLSHLYRTAGEFACQGDEEMSRAVRSKYAHMNREETWWNGEWEIFQAEGWEGLLFIAEIQGKLLTSGKEDWIVDCIFEEVEETFPEKDVPAELRRLSGGNPQIEAYLRAVDHQAMKRREIDEKHAERQGKPIPLLQRVLAGPGNKGYSRLLLKNASEEEVQEVAKQCFVETDPEKLGKLLRFFSIATFPLEHEFMLELLESQRICNGPLGIAAREALALIKAPDVRRYALERLETSSKPWRYTDFLQANFQDGDEHLLEGVMESIHEEVSVESMAWSLCRIFSENPTPKCKGPLEALYRKSNCAYHRKDLVKLLIQNDVLSEQIWREIEFDCDLDTRKLRPPTMSRSDA